MKKSKTFLEIGVVVLATFIIRILYSVLASLLLEDIFSSIALNVIGEFLYIVPSLVFVFRHKSEAKDLLHLKKLHPLSILLLIVIGWLCIPIVAFVNSISMLFTTNVVLKNIDSFMSSSNYLVMLLTTALVPAVVEEFICRGTIFGQYRKAGLKQAALLSGLLFGLLHMNLNQFMYAFVLGIMLCVVVEITGSLYSSMILHFVVNGTTGTLGFILLNNKSLLDRAGKMDASKAQYLGAAALYGAIGIVCLACIAGLLYVVAILEKRTIAYRAVNPFCKAVVVPKKEDRHVFTIPLILAIVIPCLLIVTFYIIELIR